jgi:hypothetical protein
VKLNLRAEHQADMRELLCGFRRPAVERPKASYAYVTQFSMLVFRYVFFTEQECPASQSTCAPRR